jgi:PAS domain S-box-containing protein
MASDTTLRILAIEDDGNFAATLKRLLQTKLHAEVAVADTIDAAREHLSSGSFDLITLDVQLPDGDGLDFLSKIKLELDLAPVIVVTGRGDEPTAARAFEAGASGYVIKDNRLGSYLPPVMRRALEHRWTEESLRVSEIRYRRLFEAAKDGILILDAESGRITDVNPFLKDLLGYSDEEMLGGHLWDIGPFRDVAESKELFKTLQEKDYVRYEHLPLQARDGRSVDVEFVSNVYQADHRPVIQCNIRDISQRRKHEIRQTREYLTLKGIINSTDNPIFSVDDEYRYTSFNQAHSMVMMALYGVDIEVGKSILDYHPFAEDREQALENLGRALRGEKVTVESYAGSEGGRQSFFEIVHNPITDEDGQVIGVAVFAKDLTASKESEEARRQSEEMLQTIFDAVPGMLFLKNKDNMLIRANKGLFRALGVSEEEILGRPLSDIFPNQSEQYLKDDLQVIESGRPLLGIIEQLETPQGVRWLQTDKLPYVDAGGEVVGVIGFSVDISEIRKYAADLERVNQELNGYAHTVSHDLRSPLASIGMMLHLFRDLVEGPQSANVNAEIMDIVAQMSRSLERSDDLIGSLLKLAEAGQSPEQVLAIDVGQMIDGITKDLAEQIRGREITIEVDDDMGEVVADYSHIYQVFANVISNAVAHNQGMSLRIEVRYLGDDGSGGHRYLVRDNGLGIREEDLTKVFAPFYKGKSGGSGIGLATVMKIVGVYRGKIKAYNDKGACFEFTLHDVVL